MWGTAKTHDPKKMRGRAEISVVRGAFSNGPGRRI